MGKEYFCQNEKCTHHNKTYSSSCMKVNITIGNDGRCIHYDAENEAE